MKQEKNASINTFIMHLRSGNAVYVDVLMRARQHVTAIKSNKIYPQITRKSCVTYVVYHVIFAFN